MFEELRHRELKGLQHLLTLQLLTERMLCHVVLAEVLETALPTSRQVWVEA